MNEKKTVSVGFRLTSVLKSLPQSGGTTRSSPTHSKYCSAPCFIHIFLPQVASFLYAATLFLATGITNPSTYDIDFYSSQTTDKSQLVTHARCAFRFHGASLHTVSEPFLPRHSLLRNRLSKKQRSMTKVSEGFRQTLDRHYARTSHGIPHVGTNAHAGAETLILQCGSSRCVVVCVAECSGTRNCVA